ncbi:protein containing Nitrilase/cyanide hydratase and apolipoprotein N-acyltransferase domain [Pseudovibrio sp. FO-BEG1]|uniref:carbon-nitrogen hydrolase family protein n=1 Tax=Pseudovibrio sp. (strain FO-BEG1) TaxID=911045 RepID=UPI000238D13F|nr:carbon-nitrogen hydrolase family protein [Pseudovibrio sp. FO-BEG1]AEV34527.1 protein containing Nitrilase/cyanide hydratase and apolipoprotein N-acyltransferase domain [Pseudovibrio sp. FO-BEG1]
MTSFVAACIQMRTGRNPLENLDVCEALVREAAAEGAVYVQTPEMTNVLERSRKAQLAASSFEGADPFLKRLGTLANELNIWIHIGSLAIRLEDDKLANRGFMISPRGEVVARYDKIHMFDVDLPNGESWRESESYSAGNVSPVVDLGVAKVGMAICYDIRQPALFREQSKAGAQVLTGPAAFTKQTGEAHWHVLQRSRAIENGAFVVTAAQGGTYEDDRQTYGHSLMVDPWGRVIAELDHDEPGVLLGELDMAKVDEARRRIPAIENARDFSVATVSLSGEMVR